MNRALIQQVLDALEKLAEQSDCDIDPFTFGRYGGNLAIQALRAELAKPEPEPVGEVQAYDDYGYPWKRVSVHERVITEIPVGTKVYATPTMNLKDRDNYRS